MRAVLGVLFALAFGGLARGAEPSGQRLAYIIANAAYDGPELNALEGPKNDAIAMARAFKDLGYDRVVVERDASSMTLPAIVGRIRAEAAGARQVVIYYSGHGIGAKGRVWLAPVDFKVGPHPPGLAPDDLDTAHLTALADLIAAAAPAGRGVVVYDSNGSKEDAPAEAVPANVTALYAACKGFAQEAELPAAGQPSRGLFTFEIVEALRTGLDGPALMHRIEEQTRLASDQEQQPCLRGARDFALGGPR